MIPPRGRLLVIKLADFGDALLTTPALRALRVRYPAVTLDVLTTPIGAVAYAHSGLADEVITFEKAAYDAPLTLLRRPLVPLALARRLRQRRYDAVALLHHLTLRPGALKHAALTLSVGAPVRAGLAVPGRHRAWFLTHRATDVGYDRRHEVESALAVAAALGAPAADRGLAFTPGRAAEQAATALVTNTDPPEGDPRPLVAIHPGSGRYSEARRWSPAGFAAVADGLAADGARIVLVGRSTDDTAAVRHAMTTRPLDLVDRTDLPTLAAVLRRCALLVGNDSGVTHLATAVGTPVVAVFGPSNDTAWGPWWPYPDEPSPHQAVALEALPCRPCFYVGHSLGAPAGCRTRDCLAWLPADRVLAAARSAL